MVLIPYNNIENKYFFEIRVISMNDEFEVKMSSLSQAISSGGKAVQVDIYGDGKGRWLLEVIDEFNNSTVKKC